VLLILLSFYLILSQKQNQTLLDERHIFWMNDRKNQAKQAFCKQNPSAYRFRIHGGVSSIQVFIQ